MSAEGSYRLVARHTSNSSRWRFVRLAITSGARPWTAAACLAAGKGADLRSTDEVMREIVKVPTLISSFLWGHRKGRLRQKHAIARYLYILFTPDRLISSIYYSLVRLAFLAL